MTLLRHWGKGVFFGKTFFIILVIYPMAVGDHSLLKNFFSLLFLYLDGEYNSEQMPFFFLGLFGVDLLGEGGWEVVRESQSFGRNENGWAQVFAVWIFRFVTKKKIQK